MILDKSTTDSLDSFYTDNSNKVNNKGSKGFISELNTGKKINKNMNTIRIKCNDISPYCNSINTILTQQEIAIHNGIIRRIHHNHESKHIEYLYHANNIIQNECKVSNEYIPRIKVKDNNNSESNYDKLRYIGCQYTQRNNNENNKNTNINDHLIYDNRIGDTLHQITNDNNKKNNNNINNPNSNNSIIRNGNSFEDTYFNNTFKKQREIKFPNEVTNRENDNDETTNQLKNRYQD